LSKLEEDENKTVAQSAARALREVDPGTSQPLPTVKEENVRLPVVDTWPAHSAAPEPVGSPAPRLVRKKAPPPRSLHRATDPQLNPVIVAAISLTVVIALLVWAVSRGGDVGGIDEPTVAPPPGEGTTDGPAPKDPTSEFRAFSANVASGDCVIPPKRTFIQSTREISCDFPEGTASYAVWPGQAELDRAFEFLMTNNEGVAETTWVVDGQVRGRALEYISQEGKWTSFWADDNLKSGKASFEAGDNPAAAREWWKRLQIAGTNS
jgi:hypothetical protein